MVCNLCIQLYVGITLAIFRNEGNCPVEKDILKISLNCREMPFFRGSKIFTGILFRPVDLWESNEDIINDISVLSVGVKKNVVVFVLDR